MEEFDVYCGDDDDYWHAIFDYLFLWKEDEYGHEGEDIDVVGDESEIVVPTFLLFLPMIVIIYLPLFNLEFSFPTGILFSAFAIYPAIDIAIILYIVCDYRNAIKYVWKTMKATCVPERYIPPEISFPVCTIQNLVAYPIQTTRMV
ncbi:hypothetical protein GCK72_016836 [Caenorhabditis remanei]|uniref:Uncharacterized protein n=1 Tax=Caenorhabditis remanei TaxID=31234 RepID=A0A6A5G5I2_CAERE|nr:hypothetical protein GCK72_016836 [Caenorhabditis remanei]KAF1750288.1 hypothetical protein GCK72_016836 [Caenorhabditis remanei]